MQATQIKELNKRSGIENNKRLASKYKFFEELISELNKKEIPSEIVDSINKEIDEINSFSDTNKGLLKLVKKKQASILELIEKELKLVLKNHYRNKWMAIGIGAFGVPFGVAFGAALKNMAFIGIGIPIGMAIGIAIGTAKDKEALDNGKQLDLEVNL